MSRRDEHFWDKRNIIKSQDDERKQALQLLDFELVPPDADIFDEPLECWHINSDWSRIVMGLVSWLTSVAVWKDPPYDDNNRGILQILKFLSQEVDCMNFQLRQNPTDTCLLEQSFDGGQTWSTAFDYSLCNPQFASFDSTTIENNYVTELTTYDGSAASIANGSVYDGTSDDDIRDLVICASVEDILAEILFMERVRRSQVDNVFIKITLTTLLAGLITLFTGGLASTQSLAIATWILNNTGSLLSQLSDDLMINWQARENVECCMSDGLKGVTPTFEAFRDSLDNCQFPVGSDEETLALALSEALDNQDLYVTWLATYQSIWKNRSWYPLLCRCNLDDILITFDSLSGDGWVVGEFPIDAQYTITQASQPQIAFGNPTPSFYSAYVYDTVTARDGAWVNVEIEFADVTNVESIHFDYYWYNVVSNSYFFRRDIRVLNAADTEIFYINNFGSSPENSWEQYGTVSSLTDVKKIQIRLWTFKPSGSPSNHGIALDNIVIVR